jgi:hypothetical protein
MVEGAGIVGASTLGLETEAVGNDTVGDGTAGVDKPSAAAVESNPAASAAKSTRAKTRKLETFPVTSSSRAISRIRRLIGGSWTKKHGLPDPAHI